MRTGPIFFMVFFVSLQATAQHGLSERLDSIFQKQFTAGEPGGAVYIVKNGHTVYKKGFGVEDIQTKKPVTARSLFNIGSISKTFVTYGILQLAQEKKLRLDDALGRYFTGFKNPSLAEQVRIHHLLTHTGGLPDNRKVSQDSVFYLFANDAGNWAPVMQADTLEFIPGEKWHYSNPAFNALALIIEKLSGEKWQEYISRRIFRPSGMLLSTITDGAHPREGVTHGYVRSGTQYLEKDYGEEPTFCASGNGGVWSSVEELWQYEQAIQQHVFLDSSWINLSRTVYPFANWKAPTKPFMGLSWFLTREAGVNMIGHTGSQGGFISDYVWLPEEKIFYVLLCNTPRPILPIRQSVMKILRTQ